MPAHQLYIAFRTWLHALAGQGEPGSDKNGYEKSDQPRLVFYLVGAQDALIVLPLKCAPAFFPTAANVTGIGTQNSGYITATDIVHEKAGKTVEYMP